jgi:hypothetical protein
VLRLSGKPLAVVDGRFPLAAAIGLSAPVLRLHGSFSASNLTASATIACGSSQLLAPHSAQAATRTIIR